MLRLATAVLAIACLNPGVSAAESSLLTLDASAALDVPQDTGRAVLFAEREAVTAGEAQLQVNKLLSDAVQYAKRQPGLQVSTTAYQTYPLYHPKSQDIRGWRVRASMQVDAKDFPLLSDVTTKLGKSLSIEGLSFQLSREARQKAERVVMEDAIKAFRQKATQATQSFGKASYKIKDVTIRAGDTAAAPRPYLMAKSMAVADASTPMPVEAGNTPVTVTVQGTLILE